MNYYRFTNPDGSTQVWVNLETVHAAHPSGDGKVTVHTPTFTTQVSADQFEEAMKNGAEKTKDNTFVLSRLIQAIDRLTVRMPSSIKLHM